MMKKLDISIIFISLLMIILIICSLRSEWQKLTLSANGNKKEYERNILNSFSMQYDAMIDTISINYKKDSTCSAITGLGAISIILLFLQIFNIFKTNIKFINSKFYPLIEKISLSTALVVLFTFVAFIMGTKLEIETCLIKLGKCHNSKLISSDREDGLEFSNMKITADIISTSMSGFHLMIASFIFSLFFIILSIYRYREITSPSSSIDYRFLYSGESSFLEDEETNHDGDDDTFPQQTTFI